MPVLPESMLPPSMRPAVTSPEKASQLGGTLRAFAARFADLGVKSEAARLERDAAHWLDYAAKLANTKSGEA